MSNPPRFPVPKILFATVMGGATVMVLADTIADALAVRWFFKNKEEDDERAIWLRGTYAVNLDLLNIAKTRGYERVQLVEVDGRAFTPRVEEFGALIPAAIILKTGEEVFVGDDIATIRNLLNDVSELMRSSSSTPSTTIN